ncbi:MAG: hypothetical protein M0Q88_00165 [Bacilli bacterium]|nr:hypothetical protein [Bacilli bacterium]
MILEELLREYNHKINNVKLFYIENDFAIYIGYLGSLLAHKYFNLYKNDIVIDFKLDEEKDCLEIFLKPARK